MTRETHGDGVGSEQVRGRQGDGKEQDRGPKRTTGAASQNGRRRPGEEWQGQTEEKVAGPAAAVGEESAQQPPDREAGSTLDDRGDQAPQV